MMTHFRFSGIAITSCLGLLFLILPFSAGGQDVSAEPVVENTSASEPAAPLEIKLSVSEVRLDVVVVDGRGRPITDLTADDFEVIQNRLPQQITSSVYISNQTDAAAQPSESK